MEVNQNILSIPTAIIIAGVLIALAIVGTRKTGNIAAIGETANVPKEQEIARPPIRPLNEGDHYRGNPNAPLLIVEFSDTECPFCKNLHPILNQILAEESGNVAWVYRHAPIVGLHAKAFREAEATECAAELGGEDAFWNYLDELFRVTPSNDKLDPGELSEIAQAVGLKRSKFENCLESGRNAQKVQEDLDDALASGPGSTPWSVIMTRDGKIQYPVSGALPITAWREALKTVNSRAQK